MFTFDFNRTNWNEEFLPRGFHTEPLGSPPSQLLFIEFKRKKKQEIQPHSIVKFGSEF